MAGGQVAASDVPGIRSAWSAYLPGPSCLRSVQGFIFLSVCAGTAWFELNTLDSLDAATGPHSRRSLTEFVPVSIIMADRKGAIYDLSDHDFLPLRIGWNSFCVPECSTHSKPRAAKSILWFSNSEDSWRS